MPRDRRRAHRHLPERHERGDGVIVTTFAHGIAVQAASGAGRDEFREMADAAPRNRRLS
ncbi:hypothetical protein ACFVZC_12135 [Streptomyces marokkonensis]|uniref:Uncharacterized protein n=1 Tax=Streptomyces marokkonensis TaxID=324855 RepID=A0ABW6Q512_9ACTN